LYKKILVFLKKSKW